MKTIKIENILKVIDIQKSAVHIATWNWLNDSFVTYRDEVLNENIINIQDAIDEAIQEDIKSDEPNYLPENEFTETIIKNVREFFIINQTNEKNN